MPYFLSCSESENAAKHFILSGSVGCGTIEWVGVPDLHNKRKVTECMSKGQLRRDTFTALDLISFPERRLTFNLPQIVIRIKGFNLE